jgi:putative flippase GtrA
VSGPTLAPAAPRATRLRALLLFCVAGVLALGVDLAVLYALKGLLGPYGARLLSFLCAASFTWAFNRHLTFAGPSRLGLWREYAAYLASMAVGGAVNYGMYAACIHWWPWATAHPALGVAAGSLAGLLFNFLAAERLMAAPKAQA